MVSCKKEILEETGTGKTNAASLLFITNITKDLFSTQLQHYLLSACARRKTSIPNSLLMARLHWEGSYLHILPWNHWWSLFLHRELEFQELLGLLYLFLLFILLGNCFFSSLEHTTTSHELVTNAREFKISPLNDVARCRNKYHHSIQNDMIEKWPEHIMETWPMSIFVPWF